MNIGGWRDDCMDCGGLILPGERHQVVTLHQETFTRLLGTHKVKEADVLLVRCLACSSQRGALVEVKPL